MMRRAPAVARAAPTRTNHRRTMPARDDSPRLDLLAGRHREFLRFVERRVGTREEAEEILQDAFVRGIERVDSVRDQESVVAWFYRLLRNAVIDRHRRRSREPAQPVSTPGIDVPVDDPGLQAAACACVGELLTVLQPGYAELIRQVDLEGESIGAVAARHGVPAGNARVRLHRARAALRREVERTCRTCAEHACVDCNCGADRRDHPAPGI